MPVRAARAVFWVGRALVVAALSGLFAMHGLSGLDATAATPAHGLTAHQNMPDAGPVSLARSVTDFAAATRCGMDHNGCVAVLRDAAHRGLPGAALILSEVPPVHVGAETLPVSMTSRAPPGVCLNRLCISRT